LSPQHLGVWGNWQPDGTEIFSFADMSRDFDWARINTVGPVFDLDKLGWLNGHYVRELAPSDLADRLEPFLRDAGLYTGTADERALLDGAVPLVQTRMAVLSECVDLLRCLFVSEDAFAIDPAAREKALGPDAAPVLAACADALEPLGEWTTESVQAAMDTALIEGLGLKRGKAYAPVRVAVCGASVSPPLPESMALLGKEKVLRRLRGAL
jgi:glutamyl-tRNA synthetase